MKNNKKVVLGLSGGTDSAASAILLKEAGYHVIGCFLDVTGEDSEGKTAACRAASELGIEFVYKDVSKLFKKCVINDFCKKYQQGVTPNPCIVCNPTVKFKSLIQMADEKDALYISTGHYAGVMEEGGFYYAVKGKSLKKDQSYMLYRLDQKTLSRLILPLYPFETKEEIREFVKDHGIFNHSREDSMEICFIKDGESHSDYIEKQGYRVKEGNFVDGKGKILGKHKGISRYTIGQRKGLGIALGKPAFVTEINGKTGDVVLGENSELFKKEVVSINNIIVNPKIIGPQGLEITAKIRSQAPAAKALLKYTENGMVTSFEEPVRAVTKGQSIVFYLGEKVIGGGFIS